MNVFIPYFMLSSLYFSFAIFWPKNSNEGVTPSRHGPMSLQDSSEPPRQFRASTLQFNKKLETFLMLKVKYFKRTNSEVKNYLDLVKSWNEIFSLNYLKNRYKYVVSFIMITIKQTEFTINLINKLNLVKIAFKFWVRNF